jgi:hypothetical protein
VVVVVVGGSRRRWGCWGNVDAAAAAAAATPSATTAPVVWRWRLLLLWCRGGGRRAGLPSTFSKVGQLREFLDLHDNNKSKDAMKEGTLFGDRSVIGHNNKAIRLVKKKARYS